MEAFIFIAGGMPDCEAAICLSAANISLGGDVLRRLNTISSLGEIDGAETGICAAAAAAAAVTDCGIDI